jgi:hypothetical protein
MLFFLKKITQKYHKATRDHVGAIPQALAINLATRELSEQDYDLLLQLDANTSKPINSNTGCFSQIPEKVIKSWPTEKIKETSKLLEPGYQCRICLRPYQVNQIAR